MLERKNKDLFKLKPLKRLELRELLKRQEILDLKFDKKNTIRKRNEDRIRIALMTEYGELLQELKPVWNYWKNTSKEIYKEKALEELSDFFHFLLSFLNWFEKEENYKPDFKKVEKDAKKYFSTNLKKLSKNDFEKVLLDLGDHIVLFKLFIESANRDKFLGGLLISFKAIIFCLDVTIEEFLEIHHKVWLRNLNIRTDEKY